MAYIENGVVYAGTYKKGSSRKQLRKATEEDYNNSAIKEVGPSVGETAKKAASSAIGAITGFFGGDDKKDDKKKKDSLASSIKMPVCCYSLFFEISIFDLKFTWKVHLPILFKVPRRSPKTGNKSSKHVHFGVIDCNV